MDNIIRSRFGILFILKRILEVGIGLYTILFLVVIFTGGFKTHLLGVSVSATHILIPLEIIFPLLVLRFLLSLKLKDGLLLIVSLLIGLVLIETGLRIWNPGLAKPEMVQIHRASPHFGWELTPGAHGVGRRGEGYRINSSGLRGSEIAVKKHPGTYRIVAIGDSFTFGMAVDQQETFPERLGAFLKRANLNCEVINCGVIGHNMWQHCETLKRKALAFSPDLVILALFFDDISGYAPPHKKPGEWQKFSPFRKKKLPSIMSNIYLYNFLNNTDELIKYRYRYREGHDYLKSIEERKKDIGSPNIRDANYRAMAGELEKEDSEGFSHTLKRFVSRCREKGAKILVVIIPDSIQLNEVELQGFNRLVQDLCERMQVPFLDMTPVLESQKDLSSLYLFPIDAHNSPKGQRIIGETIGKKILEMKEVLRSPNNHVR